MDAVSRDVFWGFEYREKDLPGIETFFAEDVFLGGVFEEFSDVFSAERNIFQHLQANTFDIWVIPKDPWIPR
jgi:hypothetical protein